METLCPPSAAVAFGAQLLQLGTQLHELPFPDRALLLQLIPGSGELDRQALTGGAFERLAGVRLALLGAGLRNLCGPEVAGGLVLGGADCVGGHRLGLFGYGAVRRGVGLSLVAVGVRLPLDPVGLLAGLVHVRLGLSRGVPGQRVRVCDLLLGLFTGPGARPLMNSAPLERR